MSLACIWYLPSSEALPVGLIRINVTHILHMARQWDDSTLRKRGWTIGFSSLQFYPEVKFSRHSYSLYYQFLPLHSYRTVWGQSVKLKWIPAWILGSVRLRNYIYSPPGCIKSDVSYINSLWSRNVHYLSVFAPTNVRTTDRFMSYSRTQVCTLPNYYNCL
jgi:hypothetical protein